MQITKEEVEDFLKNYRLYEYDQKMFGTDEELSEKVRFMMDHMEDAEKAVKLFPANGAENAYNDVLHAAFLDNGPDRMTKKKVREKYGFTGRTYYNYVYKVENIVYEFFNKLCEIENRRVVL